MKQFYITIACLILAGSAFAQRTIDLSVEEIIEPTQIDEKQPITVKWVLRNLGPDELKATDTIVFQIGINQNQLRTNLLARVVPRNVAMNDSIRLSFGLNALTGWDQSFSSNTCVYSIGINRGSDSIKIESGTGADDNTLCKDVDFIVEQGWGVGIDEVTFDVNNISIQPNPANREVTIGFINPELATTSVNVYDVTGKLVENVVNESLPWGKYSYSLNVEEWNPGVYFITVNTGSSKITKKFVVRH